MTPGALSFVIPARNESAAIAAVVRGCVSLAVSLAVPFEVIVVDDASTDDTAACVEAVRLECGDVRLLRHATRAGIAQTSHDGLQAARHELIGYLDGDGQFNPADFTALLARLDTAELVVGWRRSRAERGARTWGSRAYNWCTRQVGVPLHDVNCGFRMMRRTAFTAAAQEVESRSSFYFAELTLRVQARGGRVAEVPIPHRLRQGGVPSGAGLPVVWGQFRDLARFALTNRRRTRPDTGHANG